MKFKVVNEGFDRDIEPLQEAILTEEPSGYRSSFKRVKNRNDALVSGLQKIVPVVFNGRKQQELERIIKDILTSNRWEIHHIRGTHTKLSKDKESGWNYIAFVDKQTHAIFSSINKRIMKHPYKIVFEYDIDSAIRNSINMSKQKGIHLKGTIFGKMENDFFEEDSYENVCEAEFRKSFPTSCEHVLYFTDILKQIED